MDKLPEEIKLRGVDENITARLIKRTDKKAIYKRSDNVWEVFKIKTQKGGFAFGVEFKEGEIYPNNEDFGKIAWCYTNEKEAFEKYNKL